MPVAELSLGPDTRSAGAARRFLVTTLDAWGKSAYDDAALLLSELVTNAALHAKTQIVVRVELQPQCLRLAVTDGSPRQPVVRHYSEQATTGRGLGLVNSLAQRWGVESHSDGSKTVWAELTADGAARRPEDTVVDLSLYPDLEDAAPGEGQGYGPTAALLAAA